MKDLFMGIHGSVDLSKCRKFDDLVFDERGPLSRESFENFIAMTGVDRDDVYFDSRNPIHPIFVYMEGSMIEVASFDPEILEILQVPRRIEYYRKELESLKKHNDYIKYFSIIDKRARLVEFISRIKDIPVSQLYEVFEYVYTSSESGFQILSKDMILYIKEHAHLSNDYIKSMEELKRLSNEEGMVPIYRGSSSYDAVNVSHQVQSWSLNEDTARFFSTRFDNQNEVLFIPINIKDIMFYFEGRGEQEVLILA